MKTKLFVLMLCTVFSSAVFGQAYDGRGDAKMFIGYSLVGENSGLEIQYDDGLSDLFSYGARGIILFTTPKGTQEDGSFERTSKAFNSFDVGGFARFHLGDAFKMGEAMDLYIGMDFSLKSIGGHTGFKYNFSETLGLYAQYTYSFSGSISGVSYKEDRDTFSQNFFGKQAVISGGLTINLW